MGAPDAISPQKHSGETFQIVVAGKGFSEAMRTDGKLACPGNVSDTACATYRGAEVALNSVAFEAINKGMNPGFRFESDCPKKTGSGSESDSLTLKLTCEDDYGLPGRAEDVARRLVADPGVAAVIGHSLSQTTRSAIGIYAQADLPVVLPSATSTLATTPLPDLPLLSFRVPKRYLAPLDSHFAGGPVANAFQLVPNDEDGQVPAILFALRFLKGIAKADWKQVFVIANSGNNEDYARPLALSLQRRIGRSDGTSCTRTENCGVIRGTDKTDTIIGPQDLIAIVKQHPIIVYAGTDVGAPDFFQALNAAVKDDGGQHYVVLSDGVKNTKPDAIAFPANVHVLLTFPAGFYFSNEVSDRPEVEKFKRKAFLDERHQSYEMYGYDSMLLIAKAIDNLRRSSNSPRPGIRLGRSELLSAIQRIGHFEGLDSYSVYVGEHFSSTYNLYTTDPVWTAMRHTDCGEIVKKPLAGSDMRTKDRDFEYMCTIDQQSLLNAMESEDPSAASY